MEEKDIVLANNSVRNNRVRYLFLCGLIVGIAVIGRMVWHGYYFEETNNAYVTGHVSIISTRVPGVVTNVIVTDNQRVKAGDILATLDPLDQHIKIEQIRAKISLIEAQDKQIDAKISADRAEAEALLSQVIRAKAEKKRSESEALRYRNLYREDMKAVSKNELNSAIATNDIAIADLRAAIEREHAARANVIASEYAKKAQLEQKKLLVAQLKDAETQLGYHTIISPVDGYIGRKSLEIGSRVQPGQQLLAVVQQERWVTANFKETQLSGLTRGQKASIRIDALPDKKFIGIIDSISPASGAQFSLLPPDNATGNFTKIVQRVPVKIVFDPRDIKDITERVSPGMSVIVEVDKRQKKNLDSEMAVQWLSEDKL
ncbi:HlyD family secretion protein [Serratia sp. 2723]|uniref:HlyD family secretion protein n=1 Tax=unclassified Serratia (in: enterobacteria) TaxID=2647522 RepID=UPI003D228AD8